MAICGIGRGLTVRILITSHRTLSSTGMRVRSLSNGARSIPKHSSSSACTRSCTYTHTHSHSHPHTHTHTHTPTHTHTHPHPHTPTPTPTPTPTHTHRFIDLFANCEVK